MKGDDTTRRARRAGTLGAVSLRVVVALGASTGLTAAVALPMAYQAHQALQQDRSELEQRTARTAVEVLGRTTVPVQEADPAPDGLAWAPAEAPERTAPVDGSTVTGRFRVVVELPGIERVDLRIGGGPTLTATAAPWRIPTDGALDADELGPGEHEVVATVSFLDGRDELRRAAFRVPG